MRLFAHERPSATTAPPWRSAPPATLPANPFATPREPAFATGEARALRAALARMEQQLAEAGRLQRELLTSPVPEVRGATVEVLFRPAELFSGDLYHMQRLDDSHVAIIVGDATGHDHAAGLLAVFARQTLCLAEADDAGRALCDPAAMLERLNREIVARDLGECQFVAALCAVYNEDTGVIRWARAGAPMPIYVPRGAAAREVVSAGPIAGMDAEAVFETVECTLAPGDRFYIHTDGMEHALLDSIPAMSEEELRDTAWFRRLPRRAMAASLGDVVERLAFAAETGRQADDVTVVAIQRN